MTPDQEHDLKAENEFKPIVQALLDNKTVQFRYKDKTYWKPLSLYTLVVNNLVNVSFRIIDTEILLKELFARIPVVMGFYSLESEKEAIKSKNLKLFTKSDISSIKNQVGRIYFIPVNPFNLKPIECVDDYFEYFCQPF